MKDYDQFVEFCKLQLKTGDYDAHIPFFTELSNRLNLSREESGWLGLLYMAYYSEGSAWCAFTSPGVRGRHTTPSLSYPITTQRRNLYGGRLEKHLKELMAISSFVDWLWDCRTWEQILTAVGGVYGNGRWARYTTSELLVHMMGLDVYPSNYQILESSGPRKGLALLGLKPSEEAAAAVCVELNKHMKRFVVPSVLESLLCDWAGMNKGTFYAGRNIDRQQGRILQVEAQLGRTCSTLWAVRKQVFPPESLGELNGWEGIDRKRLKVYKEQRQVLSPEENR